MGLVQQEVLDFDEEIQAPWRPRLIAVACQGEVGGVATMVRRPHPSGRSSSRVGVCRPGEPRPRVPERRSGSASVAGAVRGAPGESWRGPAGSPRARRVTGGRGLRLTRRARLLAAVLMLTLGVALGSWLGPLLAGGGGDLRLAGVQSVVVQPGDTLWSIAGDAAGTGDVRGVVDKIQELNGLRGTVLMPGQVLRLP